MTDLQIWLVLLAGMAVTYGIRLSFFLLRRQEALPPLFRRGLRLVAPAALAAIITPQVLLPAGGDGPAVSPRLIAAAAAALVGWRTRSAWLAIGVGMASLWALQAIFR